MTRKDFEVIAEIVAIIGDERREVLLEQAVATCKVLEKTNERFDAERFVGRVIGKRGEIEREIERALKK